MPSPSVALLAALTTSKGRPKRLLVQENAPAFITNLGLIIGATTVKASPQDIDEVLAGLLRTDGLRPEQIWSIATHRGGTLSPTDWLSRCAAHGVATIELCMGSLFALARWSPFPATFTIVDLEAEEAFAGARLAALLTGDRAVAARVRELCLPGAGAQDYIFDAMPRGLAYDEAALASLVEQVISLNGERPSPTLRFQPAGSSLAAERDRWFSQLAEAEARHAEALREATERAAASQAARESAALLESRGEVSKLQSIVDQWEARFQEAEAESEKDAEILSRARGDLLKLKAESESARAAMKAENEALAQKLLRTERERDLAVTDASRRDDSDRSLLSELKQRVAQFEKAAAAAAEREARQVASEEASRSTAAARIAQLEAEAASADKAHTELLKRKTEAEHALASLQDEKQAIVKKLSDLDAELSESLADGAKRAAAQRAALDEQAQRAARLEGEVATLGAREAARVREWEAEQEGLSGRIRSLETERDALVKKLSELEKDRGRSVSDASRREETLRQEAAEQRQRAERLEAKVAALKEREARLTEEVTASRAGLAEEMSRLESEALLAQKASAALRAERAIETQSLAQARAEAAAASEKLAEAERDRARLQLEKDALSLKLAEANEREERQRAEPKESDAAVPGAEESVQARAWESERAEMSGRIARLEASAAEAEKTHADLVQRMTADAERTLASIRAEGEEAARKLLEVEQDRDLIRREAAGGEEAHRAALEEQRRRADQFEQDARSRAELSERIVRLEAAAAASEKARADLAAQKAEADLALESIRAEREALIRKIAAIEKDHVQTLAEAVRREDAQRQALEVEKRRAAQLAGETAAYVEREASLKREWEDARAELSERLRRAEDAALVARNANSSLVARKTEAEQSRASLQAELEEQMRLAQQLKMEAAAVAAREARKVEAAEAARAELEARLAKKEAAEAIADKARTELLNRKRDTDRALAEAQAERAALLKKLAIAENERDQARARAEGRTGGHARRTAGGAGERNTGGLSALVSLWNTAVIRRPGRNKEAEETPAEPPADELVHIEAMVEEAPPSVEAAAAPPGEPPPSPDPPAPPAAVREAAGHVAPAASPDAPRERTTGGLSALVSLWNTAATMRPFRRKETEAKSPEPPVDQVLGMEEIPDEGPAPADPAPPPGAPATPRSDRPAPVVRPRPSPPPRRTEPKPAPVPDETEKLGGWLRGLAGRMRGKPK